MVNSVADTGDGVVDEDEVVNVAVTEVLVTFNKVLDDSTPGTGSAVSNPANYVLVEAGADATLDTVSCTGGIQNNDTGIVVDSATWSSGTRTVTLGVNGAVALPDGRYTLFVCATLEDTAGNLLDGNADLTTGDDFLRDFVVDANPPVDPALNCTSHAASTWSNVNVVTCQWSGASDAGSGVDGYSVLFDTSTMTLPDTVVDVAHSSDPHEAMSSALADGNSHYFHLRTCDTGGSCSTGVHAGPFFIDTTDPVDPTGVMSTSHTVSVSSSDDTVDMSWTAGSDALSGLGGYGIEWNDSATPFCDDVQDLADDALATTSPALDDGDHYFHICTVDVAGNWTSTVTVGPFVISRPPQVAEIGSPDDPGDGVIDEDESLAGVALDQLTVTFDEPVVDSGNKSFFKLFDDGANDTFDTVDCAGGVAGDDTAVTINSSSYDHPSQTATLTLATTLPGERYRLLVCPDITDSVGNALDGNGDGTGGDDFPRTFTVVAEPPQVASVGTASHQGGLIAGGESVGRPLSQLAVVFDKSIEDPAGDVDPGDVTNPSSYLLVEDGADGTFQTAVCGAPAGDDTAVTIDAAVYDDGTLTVFLDLAGDDALPKGRYRLFACADLVDLDGAALDGNRDGTGGDDYSHDFDVATNHHFANSTFDVDLSDWIETSNLPAEIVHDSDDADGTSTSGSALVTNLSDGAAAFSLSQCVTPTEVVGHSLWGWVLIDGAGAAPTVDATMDLHSSADCTGSSLSSTSGALLAGDTTAEWVRVFLAGPGADPTTQSVLVTITVEAAGETVFDVNLDLLSFSPLIWGDDFESGDVASGWVLFP